MNNVVDYNNIYETSSTKSGSSNDSKNDEKEDFMKSTVMPIGNAANLINRETSFYQNQYNETMAILDVLEEMTEKEHEAKLKLLTKKQLKYFMDNLKMVKENKDKIQIKNQNNFKNTNNKLSDEEKGRRAIVHLSRQIRETIVYKRSNNKIINTHLTEQQFGDALIILQYVVANEELFDFNDRDKHFLDNITVIANYIYFIWFEEHFEKKHVHLDELFGILLKLERVKIPLSDMNVEWMVNKYTHFFEALVDE